MIGRVIHSRNTSPVGAILWLLVAAGALSGGLFANAPSRYHFLALTPLPVGIGLALLVCRPKPVAFEFTPDGILVHDPHEQIPYTNIEGVSAGLRPGDLDRPGRRHFPIRVVHSEGTLHLPDHLDVSSEEVFQILLSTFPESGSAPVNPLLTEYYQSQITEFGADRVFSYRPRTQLGQRRPRTRTAVAGAVTLGFLGMAIIGGALRESEYLGFGIAGFVISGFFTLGFWLAQRRETTSVKNWRQASLVISPLGMALAQGDVQGEMLWSELQTLRFGGAKKGIQFVGGGPSRGITLGFEGAQVIIVDIYDRPLHLIYRQIKRYWGKG